MSIQIVPKTFDERVKMYMKSKKIDLAKMLAERDKYDFHKACSECYDPVDDSVQSTDASASSYSYSSSDIIDSIVVRVSIYDNSIEHRLYKTETEGVWEYIAPQDWMPIYILRQNGKITGFDGEGFGCPVTIGEKIYGVNIDKSPKTVSDIFEDDRGRILLKLE